MTAGDYNGGGATNDRLQARARNRYMLHEERQRWATIDKAFMQGEANKSLTYFW